MTKELPGIREARVRDYRKRAGLLARARGPVRLAILFGATPGSVRKEVARGEVKCLPGRQNWNRGTVYKRRRKIAAASRRRNRR